MNDNLNETIFQNALVYMSINFLKLAVGSCDLFQAEKEISVSKAEQIHKMTTQKGPG